MPASGLGWVGGGGWGCSAWSVLNSGFIFLAHRTSPGSANGSARDIICSGWPLLSLIPAEFSVKICSNWTLSRNSLYLGGTLGIVRGCMVGLLLPLGDCVAGPGPGASPGDSSARLASLGTSSGLSCGSA